MRQTKSKGIKRFELKNPKIDDYKNVLEQDRERLRGFIENQHKIMAQEKPIITQWEDEIKRETENFRITSKYSPVIAKALGQLLSQARKMIALHQDEYDKAKKQERDASRRIQAIETLLAAIDHELYREDLREKIKQHSLTSSTVDQTYDDMDIEKIKREVKVLSYSIDAMMELERS